MSRSAVSDDELRAFGRLFDRLDPRQRGVINNGDFLQVVRYLGIMPDREVRLVCETVLDSEGKGHITREAFTTWLKGDEAVPRQVGFAPAAAPLQAAGGLRVTDLEQQPSTAKASVEVFRKAFDRVDVDNDGRLDYGEVAQLLVNIGEVPDQKADEMLQQLMKKVDSSGDGTLSFGEFVSLAGELTIIKNNRGEKQEEVDLHHLEDNAQRRTLRLAVLALVAYWFVGIAWARTRQGWDFLTASYFMVATFTTVGYGDFSFNGTSADKIFGGCFVFVGVVFISVAAGIVLDAVTAAAEEEAELMMKEKQKAVREDANAGARSRSSAGMASQKSHGKMQRMATDRQRRNSKSKSSTGTVVPEDPGESTFEDERRKLFRRLFLVELPKIVGMLIFGALGMMGLQGWSFADSIYFASVTMTTVGYGDVLPKEDAAKLFCIFYMIIAFGVVASSLSFLASIPFEIRKLRNSANVLSQFGDSLDPEELLALTTSDTLNALRTPAVQRELEGQVSRAEFALWQLIKQGKIRPHDITPCLAVFDGLDADRTGTLTSDDVALKVQEKIVASNSIRAFGR
eukprot:TRINITY_DN20106_c0_g1_i1.p1 TRINITY_DN20106_c0_g1~~TRINITY_DN20106_c0_g1_i1.p1  ORF type:complete len:570 (+),score=134.90 TRINITY_DN20106_c0_g1_i1:149-1858(+)